MIQRSTTISPGFDCRSVCQHEKKGDHGVCSDRWHFVVKDTDRHIALELVVRTPNYPASYTLPESCSFLAKFDSVVLSWHYAHPTEQSELFHPPQDCNLIGKCYSSHGSSIYEHEFLNTHFVVPADPKDTTQPESFWQALSAEMEHRVTQLESARRVDGDLAWKVCECCKGERVVPR